MKLKLTLLSDAVPGSGEGLAGVIDTEIAQDEYGLPYIPGKRIKGILRESAKELKDIGEITCSVEDIFGVPGQKWASYFRMSDGYLKDYENLRNFLAYCNNDKDLSKIFNRQAVLDFFTYTRTQTAIENEVAKEKSLRTLRVLKRGLDFYFDIELDEKYRGDFEKICKVTRNFGLRRTRGLGEIRLEILDEKEKEHDAIHAEETRDGDGQYRLSILIENLSELLLSTRVGRAQISDTYICGSFILGAFASAYIAQFKLADAHKDEDFYRLFLSGKVKFLNAYPTNINWQEFYPVPASLFKVKDREEYFYLKWPEEVKSPGLEYISMNDAIEYVSVGRKIEYHHARPQDRTIGHATEGNGEFFQFEVIEKGQKFLGKIIGKKKDLELLKSVIPDRSIVYLGKSRTAQYGKCRLTYGEMQEEKGVGIKWAHGESIVLKLVSDMILINDLGFITPELELLRGEIAQLCNIDKEKIEIEKAFLQFKKVSGFLSVWGLPKIQANALKAGSVIVLKNNSEKSLDLPYSYTFGIRKEEGYGEVIFEEYFERKFSNAKPASDKSPQPDRLLPCAGLIEFILLTHLSRKLKEEAIEMASDGLKVSNAFIGKLSSFIKESANFDELEGKLKELKERATRQLEKIAKPLFIKGKQVGKDKFEDDVEQELVLPGSITSKAGVASDFYKPYLYGLYQDYALTFLNVLRLTNR